MSDFISFKDYIRSLGVRELPNRQMKTGVAGAVLEFFGTHVLMWVFACVCALFLLAMTSQTIAASNPPPASLTVEWRDSCEENALAPYFTLNVSATGEVTFKGISAVKEIGERYKTISPLLARPLIRTARKILEGDPAKRLQYAAPMLPEPSSHTDCLHLEIAGMGQPSSKGLVFIESKGGIALEHDLIRATNFEKWICPARPQIPHELDYCDRPVFYFVYVERESCESSQVANIYLDGDLHYYLSTLPLTDLHTRISSATLGELRLFAEALGKKAAVPEIILPSPFRRGKLSKSERLRLSIKMRSIGLVGPSASEFRSKFMSLSGLSLPVAPSTPKCRDDERDFPVASIGFLEK